MDCNAAVRACVCTAGLCSRDSLAVQLVTRGGSAQMPPPRRDTDGDRASRATPHVRRQHGAEGPLHREDLDASDAKRDEPSREEPRSALGISNAKARV